MVRDAARPFPHPHLYAPRLVTDIGGVPAVIGFLDYVNGSFAGELTDPGPLRSGGRSVVAPEELGLLEAAALDEAGAG